MADAPELKRGLFGYRRDAVQEMLADRERMFLEVSQEARAAEERLEAARQVSDSLRSDVDKARQELVARSAETEQLNARVTQLETDLAAATSQVAEQGRRARDAEERLHTRETALLDRVAALEAELEQARTTQAAGVEELSTVLDATRDAVERIMAGARRAAEDQLADVQRTRQELETDIQRASAWREHVSPMIEGVTHEIGRAQAQVVQVSARVSEALRPMTDALSSLSRNLEDLERTAASQISQETPTPDRVDLVSHERSDEEAASVEDQQDASSAPHETPAWRGGGEGWR
jgi:chromosome segregation ATPase